MQFSEFQAAYSAAQDTVRVFEGSNDFPGLSIHDRVYALPVDWQDEEYTAIVRVHELHDHKSSQIPVTIWHWHWRGGQEAEISELSEDQLAAISDIKRTVRRWIKGELDELPPSTCRHFKVER